MPRKPVKPTERPQDAPGPIERVIQPVHSRKGWRCPRCSQVRAVGIAVCPHCGAFGMIPYVVAMEE